MGYDVFDMRQERLRVRFPVAERLRRLLKRDNCNQPFVEEAMSIPRRIREYLDSQNVPYEWLPHPTAFTAQEVAHSLHISGKRLAKTVIVSADDRIVMVVLPASHRLIMNDLRSALEARRLEMLPEGELAKVFRNATWALCRPSAISMESACGWIEPLPTKAKSCSTPERTWMRSG